MALHEAQPTRTCYPQAGLTSGPFICLATRLRPRAGQLLSYIV
jgi:hypothetical protein